MFWLLIVTFIALDFKAAAAPLAIERAAAATSQPELLLAISKVESNWNTAAVGKAGEIGALQIHPKYHVVPKSVQAQFKYADRYLRYLKRRCGKQLFLMCYNMGPRKVMLDKKRNLRYTKLVLEALHGIKQNAQNRRPIAPNTREVCYSAND